MFARAALALLVVTACGSHTSEPTGSTNGDDTDASPPSDGMGGNDAPRDAGPDDAAATTDTAPTPDAFSSVLDVRIDCHNTCVLTASPSHIDVSEGTSFEVNWINVGDTECDVAKVDQFNQVPIVIGLPPGTSYHDSVRKWCGTLFTGTFDFRVSICTLPSYIPVDCSAT